MSAEYLTVSNGDDAFRVLNRDEHTGVPIVSGGSRPHPFFV